jgi:DNA-binding MarR family transcriptional regulator
MKPEHSLDRDPDGSLFDPRIRAAMSLFALESGTLALEASAAVRSAAHAVERLRSRGGDSRGLSAGALDVLIRLSAAADAPPSGGSRNGGSRNGGSPGGGSPGGADVDGADFDDTAGGGVAPGGVAPGGVAPGGVAPSGGAAADGAAADDAVLDGAASDGGVSIGDLAKSAGVSSRNVTGLVDTLERAGLAQRIPDRRDRRSVLAQITPAGRAWMDSFRQPTEAAMAALFRGFTPAELSQLRHLCLRLIDNQHQIEEHLTR